MLSTTIFISVKVKRAPISQKGGETLEHVAQRGSGGLIPGSVQGQVGRGSEQLGLLENVPAHCSGVGLDDF